MLHAHRIALLCALLGFAQLLVSPSSAQAAPAGTTSRLADRPLAGPRAALGVGAALVIAAPLVVAIGAATLAYSGPSWFGCEDFLGQIDTQCEEDNRLHQQNVDQTMPWLIGSAVSIGVIGVGLSAFGITRLVQIKRARARVAYFQGAGFELTPRTTQVSLRFRF